MKMLCVVLALLLAVVVEASKKVPLATFDGAKATSYPWETVNDPVMGGQSDSTFKMDEANGVGVWDGEVKIVPFLKAPGFCNLQAPGLMKKANFPDASGTGGIAVTARQTSEEGLMHFNVQIMTKGAVHMFMEASYQGDFTMSSTMGTHFISWDKFKCSWRGQKVDWCPELSTQLDGITNIGIGTFYPGTAGKFHVEVKEISAASSSSTSTTMMDAAALGVRWFGSFSSPQQSADTAAADGHSDEDTTVMLAVFGQENKRSWKTEDDPVMGGQSESKVTVHQGSSDEASYLDYTGDCRIVPKLKAPGFTFALTDGQLTTSFPDVSKTDGLFLKVRNLEANVTTFKFAFCDSRINPYACQMKTYKADFDVAPAKDFADVFLPWSKFSNKWSPYTGEPTEPSPPKADSLSSITQLQIWVEGVAGHFHLQVQSIRAGKAPAAAETTSTTILV